MGEGRGKEGGQSHLSGFTDEVTLKLFLERGKGFFSFRMGRQGTPGRGKRIYKGREFKYILSLGNNKSLPSEEEVIEEGKLKIDKKAGPIKNDLVSFYGR